MCVIIRVDERRVISRNICFAPYSSCLEITVNKQEYMKIIAFYLPQFHAIPENDAWWGAGFTEWTNTKKAVPLFKGHYQPKTPLNENYYNLLDTKTIQWQCELARKYGVWGFCFYHYWFKDGKKLLEKPVELFLASKECNQNFCLCWANENWTRCWDGKDKEVLMEQDYGNEKDWKAHFDYLLPFFLDSRYIFNDGKPVFVIYKPEYIPMLQEMVTFWNQQAKMNGLEGISIVSQFPSPKEELAKIDSVIDYQIQFEPMYTLAYEYIKKSNYASMFTKKPVAVALYLFKRVIRIIHKRMLKMPLLKVTKRPFPLSYDSVWELIVSRERLNQKFIPGAFTDWDNSARRGVEGRMFKGSTPDKYKKYLSKLIRQCTGNAPTDLLFITAWNEWAEGSYLEPDEKNKYGYLQATLDALCENGDFSAN